MIEYYLIKGEKALRCGDEIAEEKANKYKYKFDSIFESLATNVGLKSSTRLIHCGTKSS